MNRHETNGGAARAWRRWWRRVYVRVKAGGGDGVNNAWTADGCARPLTCHRTTATSLALFLAAGVLPLLGTALTLSWFGRWRSTAVTWDTTIFLRLPTTLPLY